MAPGTQVADRARLPFESRARNALIELNARLLSLEEPADLSFAAAEIAAQTLGVSRAGYGTVDKAAETITIERDWNAPGILSLRGVLKFRDFGSYVEDLKRGDTVVFADAELDSRTGATASALKAISAQAVVNMPVSEQGGLVALFYLNHKDAREWTEDELRFIRDIASRTRSAVERRRAEHALRDLAMSLESKVQARTAELHASEARMRAVFETTYQVQGLLSPDGAVLDANQTAMRFIGGSLDDVIGLPFWDTPLFATTSGTPERIRAAIVAVRNGQDFRGEVVLDLPTGTRTFDLSIRASRDRQGTIVALVLQGVDITERRLIEEALRQSQKMEAVGQLTGGLAHDFNNLLMGITGSLEVLLIRLAQGRTDELERYVNVAKAAAKRASALTHRLLAFSRRQTLSPKRTDVNTLVSGMSELIRRTMGPGIVIEAVSAAGLWTTLIDPHQLENALLNLCINARDAMPDGGRLMIETGNTWLDERAAADRDLPAGQYVSLSVSDTGSGMLPEVVRCAFDPFFTTKPLGMGTGLGLSMVYGFVRQSGGQARIYSEPGKGTMVCLYLPRHAGDAELDDAPLPEPQMARAHDGETILVVDDEPAIRMLANEVLADLGYRVLEAGDGEAALKIIRSSARIDLLVSDVGLPGGMNGRQVAEAARVERPALKVLFITGYAENAVLSHGHLDVGMHVLTKPFALQTLADRVKTLMGGA
nr:response regulator [Robbsia betulipollinis]